MLSVLLREALDSFVSFLETIYSYLIVFNKNEEFPLSYFIAEFI